VYLRSYLTRFLSFRKLEDHQQAIAKLCVATGTILACHYSVVAAAVSLASTRNLLRVNVCAPAKSCQGACFAVESRKARIFRKLPGRAALVKARCAAQGLTAPYCRFTVLPGASFSLLLKRQMYRQLYYNQAGPIPLWHCTAQA